MRCQCLRRIRLGFKACGTLGQDQRMGTDEIGGQVGQSVGPWRDITTLRPSLPSFKSYPTDVGRQVFFLVSPKSTVSAVEFGSFS
jgi:hypothetical protein